MVRRALIERRPWLFASLLVALAWWAFSDSDMVPGLYKMVWKAVPLALLAIYAFQRHLGTDGTILSGIMATAAMADAMSELHYLAAGTIMALSLFLAVWLYARNRRAMLATSQKLLAILLVITVPIIAWYLLPGVDGRQLVTGYGLLIGIMAAMAWTSRFSRYRVGAGAMLFVVSELVLFSISGPLMRDSSLDSTVVWPLYYAGQLLIATGVVSGLRRAADA
ncbi:lysoplasmalogenase [Croceicoccus ponticola]|uniref:Lysoplasmalogenase n=1 Tax=Croceicoccus ponticola TaxID=2217664 RepID=A0A437H0D5_9SPHN|nr:lysoplasmalogenase family protein [Croceicoccus ponticola]RVQ69087.1 lysoplasmalogenase [Croceicoccus ponticola]